MRFIFIFICTLTSCVYTWAEEDVYAFDTQYNQTNPLHPEHSETMPKTVPQKQIYNLPNTSEMESALAFYQHLPKHFKWPILNHGPLLSFGDTHSDIHTLRKQLQLLGDYIPDSTCDNSDLFDIELHEALMTFQHRHGSKTDGILGPQSRRLLNIKPQQRVAALKLNIYRISEFGQPAVPYIRVNIPEFNLRLIQADQPPLLMKTIVGKRKRKTPIFTTEVDRIVINPSWHVPKSIAYKDILPEWENNPDHLKKLNLQVVSGWGAQQKQIPSAEIDLNKMYQGKNYHRFWEPPSTRNTLGKVKFLTNSQYSIYLHDTSAKRLFKHPKRSFSSGCIRLEQPRKLADALLASSNFLQKSEIDPFFDSDKTKQIKLDKPIKLFTTYWTAWQDENGTIHYRDDLYRRDRQDLATLRAMTPRSASLPLHVADKTAK